MNVIHSKCFTNLFEQQYYNCSQNTLVILYSKVKGFYAGYHLDAPEQILKLTVKESVHRQVQTQFLSKKLVQCIKEIV